MKERHFKEEEDEEGEDNEEEFLAFLPASAGKRNTLTLITARRTVGSIRVGM